MWQLGGIRHTRCLIELSSIELSLVISKSLMRKTIIFTLHKKNGTDWSRFVNFWSLLMRSLIWFQVPHIQFQTCIACKFGRSMTGWHRMSVIKMKSSKVWLSWWERDLNSTGKKLVMSLQWLRCLILGSS